MNPGNYRASAEKDGFAPASSDLLSLLANTRVTSGGDPVKMDVKLTPLDKIRGRVLDPDGAPAAGVEINVFPNIMADMSVTDEDGRFGLENIRPGSYTLIAKPPENANLGEAKDGTRTATVTTYYPSVTDRSLAQQIVFDGHGDSGGYEIRMKTATVRRVRGIVLDEEGKPSPGAELMLFPMPEGTSRPMGLSLRPGGRSVFALGLRPGLSGPEATVAAGKDGHFEFPAVQSGIWRINAVSNPKRDDSTSRAAPLRATASLIVGPVDVDDLSVHLARPFKLTGTVEWNDEGPGSHRVYPGPLSPVTLMTADGTQVVPSAPAGLESGRLSFENLVPGDYRLIVNPGLLSQIFLGDIEITGTFQVTAGGSPPLRVVLKTWSGTVRGAVENCEGAMVVLVPQRVEGVVVGQSVPCGAGGSFELSEVSPGDYTIAAFDHMDGFQPSAAMLNLVQSRGTSVRVEERSVASVTLSVIAALR